MPETDSIDATLLRARAEADRLARLLHEAVPDGDEIKGSLYSTGLAIKHALPAIRAMEGSETANRATPADCAGVG